MHKVPKPLKLESESLWVDANLLVEHVYSKLPELPEEEKWDTTAKLQHAAVNLLFGIGESLGAAAPGTNEYEWGNTRQHAASLKTMYRFAGRQKFFELEPAIMVQLDTLIAAIDARIAEAYEQTAQKDANDLAFWREKYRLSKGAEHESQP